MVDFKALQEKLKSGSISGGSKYKLRNEEIQTKKRVKRYPALKKDKGTVFKVCVRKDLPIPFNPADGTTEVFNEHNCFRPVMSATSLALLCKKYAEEVPATKERFMSAAGISEWDTSDCTQLTEVDKKVFGRYAKPMIFTPIVFHTSLPGLSKNKYGADFMIEVQRDDITGQVIGDAPLPILANQFYTSVALELFEQLKQDIKDKKVAALDDEALKDKRADFFKAEVKVSDDHPVNFLIAMKLPLNPMHEIAEPLAQWTGTEVDSHCFNMRMNSKLQEALNRYATDPLWKSKDINFDYYEIDVTVPNIDSDTDRGQKTTYDLPMHQIQNESFNNLLRDKFDAEENVEEIMFNSMYIQPFGETQQSIMIEAINETTDLKDPKITNSVIQNNQEFVKLVFGTAGVEAVLEATEGLSDRPDGVSTVEEAQKMQKEYNVEALLAEDAAADAATESAGASDSDELGELDDLDD